MVARLTMDHDRFAVAAAALMLAIAVVLSILLIRAPGTSDVEMFLIWGSLGRQHGIAAGYKVMVDHWPQTVLGGDRSAGGGEYPPLGFAWLTLVCIAADIAGVSHFLAYKCGLLLFSLISTGMIWWLYRSMALAAAFQAAIILCTSGLGYMDIVPVPFLIGALWAMREERPVTGLLLFLVSVLLKWQPLILAPFLAVHMLKINDLPSIGRVFSQRLTWRLTAGLLAVVGCVWAAFGASPVQAFLWALHHPYLSGNALNAAWVATFLIRLFGSPDFTFSSEIAFLTLPAVWLMPFKLVFFALFGVVLLRFIRVERTFANCLIFGILGVVTYGIWNSAVHENHWFVAMIVAFMLAGESRTAPTYWIAILTAAMFNVNLFVFYGITGPEVIARDVGIDLSVILSLLFVAIWFLLVRHAWSLGLTRQPAEQ